MVKVKDILKLITCLCVITGYASVIQYVQIYYSICFAFLFAISIYFDYSRTVRIPRWILNSISVMVLVLSFFRITPDYLVEPVLDALVILTAIKLLEEKQFRDYMQIHSMCVFLLLGSSFISISIVFLVYFIILATLSTASLVLLAYFSHDSEMAISKETLAGVIRHSLLICSIAIPASAIFFLILPRTNYPILSFLNKYASARTGFSDTVSLGEVSGIQEDNNVIFRAEMDRIEDRSLYWRGIVLDRFDGTSWKSSHEESQPRMISTQGPVIEQTIYLEPYGNKYLFALDKPTSIALEKSKVHRLTYRLYENLYERVRYKPTSVLSELLPESEIDLGRYLQLPDNFSPRTRELVNSLAGDESAIEILRFFIRFIGQGDYKYSMDDLPVSETPLEDFLFSHRRGNCEYFASALAVMLRMAEIPARLVGGYKGGHYNQAGGYYMVLQKSAHIWVEAYIPGRGWLRVDPTPPIESSSVGYGSAFLMRLRLLMDTFNYYWFKFVINYDFSKQLLILNKIRSGIKQADFKFDSSRIQYKKYLPVASTALALAILIFCILKRARNRKNRLISKFLKRMSHYGYKKGNSEGLEEFVSRIDKEDLKSAALIFVTEFQKIYYKDLTFTKDDVRRLEASLREM